MMTDVLDYCEGMPRKRYEAGTTIIAEGERIDGLHILIRGDLEVLRQATQVSHIDEPGSILGEMAVLLDQPASASVKALSEAEMYVVADASAFLASRPEVALHLATLLARRLYYTTTYLVDLQQQAAGKRQDLDLVDQILAKLAQPGKGGAAS